MKKIFSVLSMLVAMLISTTASAQITGVELMREKQGSAFQTNENDQIIRKVEMDAPIVVCGGGLSGLCAAVAAARHGSQVVRSWDLQVLTTISIR